MRHGANVDKTQPPIVAALRKVGASVLHLHQLGLDAPDVLVGFRGKDLLMEIKTPGGKPTDGQLKWHRSWRGRTVAVVYSSEQALIAIGAIRE